MSIVWLEPFIFDVTETNIFTFQSLNIVVYFNLVSCICFLIYSFLYKLDKNMQKQPSN
jgi:hypothetical protein